MLTIKGPFQTTRIAFRFDLRHGGKLADTADELEVSLIALNGMMQLTCFSLRFDARLLTVLKVIAAAPYRLQARWCIQARSG